MNDHKNGLTLGVVAYVIWGFFPIYFKLLQSYSALAIMGHRIVWTFLSVAVMVLFCRHFHGLKLLKAQPKWLAFTFFSSLCIANNWLIYVWAVNHNQVLEASLGYFISPLAGIALAMIVLKEKLRTLQWLALALAVFGVLLQIVLIGRLPWVSLALAATFSVYGLMHRKNPLDALSALFVETVCLLPFCLIGVLLFSNEQPLFADGDLFLLFLSGPITLLPLLLYNRAAKLLAFTRLNFIGYIGPSLVFLLAIFVYHEPFDQYKLVTFLLIWAALACFSWDLWRGRNE